MSLFNVRARLCVLHERRILENFVCHVHEGCTLLRVRSPIYRVCFILRLRCTDPVHSVRPVSLFNVRARLCMLHERRIFENFVCHVQYTAEGTTAQYTAQGVL